ncbi:MAG: aspartate/tyrosine/aromatic aminotransferase [Planctomycetia bacterium]|nr:aspartate/tyrosine/aromatic aminotransferase [Planctomycetia bacterium]
MFEKLSTAPPDPILGLTEAFKRDANPRKINLSVGVYQDASGKTPVLASVKAAEQRLLESEATKNYLSIEGLATYGAAVRELLFDREHEVVRSGRAATAQTPGGTGALRVAGELVRAIRPTAKVWLSDPTWPNHGGIFTAAGLEVATYPYYDAATQGLAIESLLSALEKAAAGDVVLLHACCHNPTGVDPTPEQWQRIAQTIERRGLLPLVDFAYQGFGDGLSEDAAGLRALCRPGGELLVCSSFSKNFGLYNERVGALTIVAESAAAAETALGHAKLRIRTNYSNPPAHGGAVVASVLADPTLRAQWEAEVATMRGRINAMRRLFVETLAAKGVKRDFSFLERQRGMFSFSGLTPQQVAALREQHALYIVGSGRINVAGMTEANMGPLCEAIAAVL